MRSGGQEKICTHYTIMVRSTLVRWSPGENTERRGEEKCSLFVQYDK